jgi:hypothetical protein
MTTPLRTAEKDLNYLSLNRDSIVWYAGTPDEHQGDLPYPLNLLPDNPKAWDAILKFSGRHNTSLCLLKIAQGKENAVDLNNECRGIALEGSFGVTGNEGEQVFTIKGGTEDVLVKGTIHSRGVKADIVVGAWSDQSTKTSHHLDLSLLRHASGRPLTVILGRVNSPLRTILLGRSPDIALPANATLLRWASLKEWVYWWGKRVYVLIRYRR